MTRRRCWIDATIPHARWQVRRHGTNLPCRRNRSNPPPPFIETTYPGQTKRTIKAPRHIYEHFLKHPESELPFIEPVGEFKQWLEIYREDRRKAREMFERDEAGRRRDGVAAS
jgi:hypothetical protein